MTTDTTASTDRTLVIQDSANAKDFPVDIKAWVPQARADVEVMVRAALAGARSRQQSPASAMNVGEISQVAAPTRTSVPSPLDGWVLRAGGSALGATIAIPVGMEIFGVEPPAAVIGVALGLVLVVLALSGLAGHVRAQMRLAQPSRKRP